MSTSDDWEYRDPPPRYVIWPAQPDRRRGPRTRLPYHVGMRVVVTGPFDLRVGPGTVARICRDGRGGIVVNLDTGKDVLVARRYARPEMPQQHTSAPPENTPPHTAH